MFDPFSLSSRGARFALARQPGACDSNFNFEPKTFRLAASTPLTAINFCLAIEIKHLN